LSFKTIEAKDTAQDTHVTLGNTTLDWYETTTKLCAICASAVHDTKNCNIKASQLQKAQEKKENMQKFGHLYRRYKPTGVPAQNRFTKSIQQFKTKSFAEAVKERKHPIAKLTQSNSNEKTPDQPSLKQIMQAIQQLAEEIKQIKTSLNNMDERIGTIEDDRYYHYTEQEQESYKNMEEAETTEDPNRLFSFIRQQTSPHSTQSETDDTPNYPRKRAAHSPAQDLHERQNNLHVQIDNMGNTLQLIADLISHLHQPTSDNTTDNTTSSDTNQ
jgi:DNA repair exonuclease SbcCD ATPase subunit